jgi:hypothetical protein
MARGVFAGMRFPLGLRVTAVLALSAIALLPAGRARSQQIQSQQWQAQSYQPSAIPAQTYQAPISVTSQPIPQVYTAQQYQTPIQPPQPIAQQWMAQQWPWQVQTTSAPKPAPSPDYAM